MRAHLALALLLISACKTSDPLYCDEDTPCTDPDRPYCDLTGEYPASDGHGRTCIASPFDGGVGDTDGGSGDPDDPDAAGPRRIAQISVGSLHSCARFNDGGLRCWGSSQLGYGGDDVVGDNEAPYEAGDIATGGRVASVAVGNDYTCILYEEGNVKCWGSGTGGKLGYGNTSSKSDPPDQLPDVPIGGKAIQIATARSHTCVLLEGGLVRCWGAG
ncbi:MAG TPA: hypothetical protein VMZ28_30675, partial [Kofleriaceae bacterium]|nr:hypothetical protein [Kofleriaceae bacterium]